MGKYLYVHYKKAENFNIPVPTVVPGQERKWKVSVHFQNSPTVSQVGAQFESVEAYFRSSEYFTFLDTMSEELNRRFKAVLLPESFSRSTP